MEIYNVDEAMQINICGSYIHLIIKNYVLTVCVLSLIHIYIPNDKDDSIMGVGNGKETDQFQENKVDQVADNEVSNNDLSESNKTHMIKMMIKMCKELSLIHI